MTTPRYRRARELAGLSIAQAARMIGTGACELANMEIHATDPILRATADIEHRMADLYGCSLAWLRGEPVELSTSVRELLSHADKLSFADRDALDELLRSMGRKRIDNLGAEIARLMQPCSVNPVSSRACERGTKGCVVQHAITTHSIPGHGDWRTLGLCIHCSREASRWHPTHGFRCATCPRPDDPSGSMEF